MQPFDALSIRAVLNEAKPVLINKRVDKVLQLARDEILINLRSKAGSVSVFLSAQSVYGRMCVIRIPSSKDTKSHEKSQFERYKSKYGSNTPPNFCIVLRRHLTGSTLIGIEQLPGDRIVDFVFSCTDEVGTKSIKILTAEIMGRHSNLIFWDKESSTILASSHTVTKEMSRQREVLQNIPYKRPPGQQRPNIFLIEKEVIAKEIYNLLEEKKDESGDSDTTDDTNKKTKPVTLEQWLLATFTGIGRHLCEELIFGSGLPSQLKDLERSSETKEKLISKIMQLKELSQYNPTMQEDLSKYSLLGWYQEKDPSGWKKFDSSNDLIETYFRSLEAREHYIQLREKIKAEINSETQKLEARREIASSHLSKDEELEKLKFSGDTILTNIREISPGQSVLVVENWQEDSEAKIEIKLNPDISSAQNAQTYYRKYAKGRARKGAAQSTMSDVDQRLGILNKMKESAEKAPDINALRQLKETLSGKKQHNKSKPQHQKGKKRQKSKLTSLISSDGWTIYVGRNRNENDQLIGKIANPNDLWFHVSGQGGAHVLVRVPQTKQDPPKSTIFEAAQVAARLSKAAVGTKVRVIYTRCKHVKKIDKKKPGLVRYEHERTIEVDTGRPMPKLMKKLFR